MNGTSVSEIVSAIVREAALRDASSVHLEPRGKEIRVRYRVGGLLRPARALPGYLHAPIVSRFKVLAGLKLDETRFPQDGRMTQVADGRAFEADVSTLPVVDGEKVVLRVRGTGIPSLGELGFCERERSMLAEAAAVPGGMIVVADADGSGASATLLALVNLMRGQGLRVSTLEDPVEHVLPGVRHAQVRPETGFTFANGLRALLREEADAVMIGELRDRETGELASHASLTGQTILFAVPANDAASAVSRLHELGVEPLLLSVALKLLVIQRAVRKICPDCKISTEVPKERERLLRNGAKDTPEDPPVFFKGVGCPRCSDTGYRGRLLVAELVPGAREERQEGMSMRQDAILKALEGTTTVDEVVRVSFE